MLISGENLKVRNAIFDFEKRIDEMQLAFEKYYADIEPVMPDWERLERDLLSFSRKRIIDLELSKHMERILYKFQNRKKIWLSWVEEVHKRPRKE